VVVTTNLPKSLIIVCRTLLDYTIPADRMPASSQSSSSSTVKCLSSSECVEFVKSGACERFLRRFAVDYVPGPSGYWPPVRLVEQDLLELMKTSSAVMLSYDDDASADAAGREMIVGLSYAESLLLRTKLRRGELNMEVVYFGERLGDLVEHLRAHLCRSTSMTRGRNLGFVVNFPTCIDRDDAATTISRDVTGGIKHTETATNAHLSSIELNPERPLRTSKL